MTKLSDTQSAILSAAIASEDETTLAPPEAKSAVAGLIKRGFLISVPQADGPSRLMITATGRQALAAPSAFDNVESPPKAAVEKPKPRGPFGAIVAISLGSREPVEKSQEVAPPLASAAPDVPKGKIGALVELLRQEGGTTVEAMMAATGWQAHSVRGALSGAIKKGLGLEVISQKTETGRVYRIASGDAA
jgi:hypothetical protein